MSKNLSAIKKNKIASRNRLRNKIYKSSIKTWTKKYLLSLDVINESNIDSSMNNLSIVYQKIDKAVKRGILHKNKGARKKSALVKAMKAKLMLNK
uniref:Ribosomal protein S20 n=1 Tax=Antithamnionella ternifolia TaxID=207919 RepID=A0A4D6WJN6_9FLOR|nr:ribosomal protein S20 [Antithamnionella ternifolia]